MTIFKKGDKISYTRTWGKGEIVYGIFESYDNNNKIVWAYWNGAKSLTYIEASVVKLVKAKGKHKANLPEWW